MEVVGRYGKKVLWDVSDDRVIEEATDHDDIGLRGLVLIFSEKTRRG